MHAEHAASTSACCQAQMVFHAGFLFVLQASVEFLCSGKLRWRDAGPFTLLKQVARMRERAARTKAHVQDPFFGRVHRSLAFATV